MCYTRPLRLLAFCLLIPFALLGLNDLHAALFTSRASLPPKIAADIQIGDVIFTREPYYLLRKVADASGSWANHVGIVVDTTGPEPLVAESKVPKSVLTPLSRFVGRSEAGHVVIRRPAHALETAQKIALFEAADARLGRWYDLGFNLYSERQFCSRLVHESLLEATGESVGKVQSFRELLAENPKAPLTFWRIWFFGRIPWERQTVTPASLLDAPQLVTIYDAHIPAAPILPDLSANRLLREMP